MPCAAAAGRGVMPPTVARDDRIRGTTRRGSGPDAGGSGRFRGRSEGGSGAGPGTGRPRVEGGSVAGRATVGRGWGDGPAPIRGPGARVL